MTTSEIETELKYEAPAGAVLPPLDSLPAVSATRAAGEEHLEAQYYDTDDLRLIRSGITLRRRAGGHDDGWHLKMPAGADSRRELRVPFGADDGTVPAELAKLVRSYTRGEPIKQVAVISTMRQRMVLLGNGGQSVAEIATDDVSATRTAGTTSTSRWREVEIELTGGDRRVLDAADKLLRRSGLRRATHSAKLERVVGIPPRDVRQGHSRKLSTTSRSGDVILAYLSAQVERLTALDPLVRRDEPDAVHQLRVSTRLVRSTLQTYGSLIWRSDTGTIISELRWLGVLLGAARDAEVQARHLQANLAETPVELVIGPVQTRVRDHFVPVGAQARVAILEALDSRRYFALLDQLDALVTDPSLTTGASKPAKAVLPRAVRRAYRRTDRRMRRASRAPAGQAQETALHQARKAAKRARYAAEAVTPAMGRKAGRFAKRMKQVQTSLGDYQDSVIARDVELKLGTSAASAGENAFTYGLLYERDVHTGEQARAKTAAAWQHAKKRRHREWLR